MNDAANLRRQGMPDLIQQSYQWGVTHGDVAAELTTGLGPITFRATHPDIPVGFTGVVFSRGVVFLCPDVHSSPEGSHRAIPVLFSDWKAFEDLGWQAGDLFQEQRHYSVASGD